MSSTPLQLAEPIQDDSNPIQPDDPTNMGLPSIPTQREDTEGEYLTELEDLNDLDGLEILDGLDDLAGVSDDALDALDAQVPEPAEEDVMTYSLTDSLMLHLVSEHGLVGAVNLKRHEQFRWHRDAHTIGVKDLDDPSHMVNDLSWRPEVAISLIFEHEPVPFPGPDDDEPPAGDEGTEQPTEQPAEQPPANSPTSGQE